MLIGFLGQLFNVWLIGAITLFWISSLYSLSVGDHDDKEKNVLFYAEIVGLCVVIGVLWPLIMAILIGVFISDMLPILARSATLLIKRPERNGERR